MADNYHVRSQQVSEPYLAEDPVTGLYVPDAIYRQNIQVWSWSGDRLVQCLGHDPDSIHLAWSLAHALNNAGDGA